MLVYKNIIIYNPNYRKDRTMEKYAISLDSKKVGHFLITIQKIVETN